MSIELDDIRHNCGVVVAHTLHDVFSKLGDLQHRGKEAVGIAAIGKNKIDILKWKGKVNDFDKDDLHNIFPADQYDLFMGHVRYATRGKKSCILEDAHPHFIPNQKTQIFDYGDHIIIRNAEKAIIHNGTANAKCLDDICVERGLSGNDSLGMLHYYDKYGEEKIMKDIPGSYTFAIADINRDKIIIGRDFAGNRPGSIGEKNGKTVMASEDHIITLNGGKNSRDINPGSLNYIFLNGSYEEKMVLTPKLAHCFFEWNYIAHKESILNGLSVKVVREKLGRMLAVEFPMPDADFVSYFPRCPEIAAYGYENESKIKRIPIFYKKNSDRSFIGSTEEDRRRSIKGNVHLIPGVVDIINGKYILVIEDSFIRGNNSKRGRDLLFDAEVGYQVWLSYTPPVGIIGLNGEKHGCLYGVDMPPNDNFIARGRSESEISKQLRMPVRYLSVEGMLSVFESCGMPRENLCYHCIGGPKPF